MPFKVQNLYPTPVISNDFSLRSCRALSARKYKLRGSALPVTPSANLFLFLNKIAINAPAYLLFINDFTKLNQLRFHFNFSNVNRIVQIFLSKMTSQNQSPIATFDFP